MFVELNREESQRYLDEMKRSLASNNSNTYSVGSSVPTFSPNYGQSLVPPIPPPAPRMTVVQPYPIPSPAARAVNPSGTFMATRAVTVVFLGELQIITRVMDDQVPQLTPTVVVPVELIQ